MTPSQAAGTGRGSELTINFKVEHKFTLELPDPVTAVAADSTKAPSINVEDKLALESADLEAYVSYFGWWAGLNFVAGYVAILVALALISHSIAYVTIMVLGFSSGICFWACCAFFSCLGGNLSHIDQINTRPFRIRMQLGYLTFLCGLCLLLFIVVTYILSTPVPPAPAPALAPALAPA